MNLEGSVRSRASDVAPQSHVCNQFKSELEGFTQGGGGDIKPRNFDLKISGLISMPVNKTQRAVAREILRDRGIVRLSEFTAAGITAATIGRMRNDGEVVRLAPGLYQLPDAPLDANHSLAEAAKRVPKGVVCLVSALAFHELTDQLPQAVWLAIGKNDWSPQDRNPPLRIARFTDSLLSVDVETVLVGGVTVKVFGVAKTVADCFRHRRSVGQSVALEGLQEALRQRKATPAEIAQAAVRGNVSTIVRPYLEALTANG